MRMLFTANKSEASRPVWNGETSPNRNWNNTEASLRSGVENSDMKCGANINSIQNTVLNTLDLPSKYFEFTLQFTL
jgi:hypothetical protein